MKKQPSSGRGRAAATQSSEQLVNTLLEVALGLRGRLEEALQTVGLSAAKYQVLKQLAEGGEPLALGELAAGQRCAASNITQLVDRLEADGLVRRVDEPTDRRSKRAELTTLGRERQTAGARQIARVQTAFMDSLSDTDRAALAKGLAGAK